MNSIINIDFLACERHNLQHLLPVWDAIPQEYRGTLYILTSIDNATLFSTTSCVPFFSDDPLKIVTSINARQNLVVTSSFYDPLIEDISTPLCFIAHGAGQTFQGQPLHLMKRKNYILDILPNSHMAKAFSHRYPEHPIHIVGCPKLDKWHTDFQKPHNSRPVIALSFHFDRQTLPETRSAWPHFKEILPALARQPHWKILGHGHPRMLDELSPIYTALGIEIVRDFDEVMERADLYVCDQMSTLYEFASTDRPVVVLNAPWYRRDIEHGLRFWEHADVGINCDHPSNLFSSIELALTDPFEQQKKRRKAVNGVYTYSDGKCAQRAANTILECAKSWESQPGFLYPATTAYGIQKFLTFEHFSPVFLSEKCHYHQQEILKFIREATSDNFPHLSDIEFHFWSLGLFLCKLKKIEEAKKICTDYYASFGGSEVLSELFKTILLFPSKVTATSSDAPSVSVVIPLYNQGIYLEDAVKSIINQSHTNWELTIVNDGSTDDSLHVARSLADKYSSYPIRVLSHQNKGKGFTRNRGIAESDGQYVCVLDADDMLASTYFQEAIQLLEANADTGWITPLTLQFGHIHQIFYHFDFDLKEMLTVCPSPISSVFRRSIWDEVRGFDETMTDREDWDFWIKAAEAGWTSLHTASPQFMYRIQARRFGERTDVNIKSKQELIRRHPWWFKSLTENQLLDYCSQFSTCNFSSDILNIDSIEKFTKLPKKRTLRKQTFDKIINNSSSKLSKTPDSNSAEINSLLRLSRHYANKGDDARARRYRDAAERKKALKQ